MVAATSGYARLSNRFWRTTSIRKMRRVNPAAAMLYVMSISFASDDLNDGYLSEDDVYENLLANDEEITYLVDNGFWTPVESGGWQITSYLDYNMSCDEVKGQREQVRERVQEHRRKKKHDSETVENTDISDCNGDVTRYSSVTNESVTRYKQECNTNVTPLNYKHKTINNKPKKENFKEKNSEKPETASEDPPELIDPEYSSEFEQFWQVYPKKVGKRRAFQAWRSSARNRPNLPFVLSKLTVYAALPEVKDGYALNPARWIDERRWEDTWQPQPQAGQSRHPPASRSEANLQHNLALIQKIAAEEHHKNPPLGLETS